jgi:hypothetical protein
MNFTPLDWDNKHVANYAEQSQSFGDVAAVVDYAVTLLRSISKEEAFKVLEYVDEAFGRLADWIKQRAD